MLISSRTGRRLVYKTYASHTEIFVHHKDKLWFKAIYKGFMFLHSLSSIPGVAFPRNVSMQVMSDVIQEDNGDPY